MLFFFFLLQKKQQRTINMITATTSIPITKPTIKPISLFWSVDKTPPFVVLLTPSSLTDAVVVMFFIDEVLGVDVTGTIAVVAFGSLIVVVAAAAIVVGCDVTGDNDKAEDGDVVVFLTNCVVFPSKGAVGGTVLLVLFDGFVGEVSLVVVAVATITSSGSK